MKEKTVAGNDQIVGGIMSFARLLSFSSLLTSLILVTGCNSTKPSSPEPGSVAPNSTAVTQKQITAVQDRHKSDDPCCKRGLYVPGTGVLRLRSAAVS